MAPAYSNMTMFSTKVYGLFVVLGIKHVVLLSYYEASDILKGTNLYHILKIWF